MEKKKQDFHFELSKLIPLFRSSFIFMQGIRPNVLYVSNAKKSGKNKALEDYLKPKGYILETNMFLEAEKRLSS